MESSNEQTTDELIAGYINKYNCIQPAPVKTSKRKILNDIFNQSSNSPNDDDWPPAASYSSDSSIIIEATSSLLINDNSPSNSFSSPFSISSLLNETRQLIDD